MNPRDPDDAFDRRLRDFLALRADEVAAASASGQELLERVIARPGPSPLVVGRRALTGFAALALLLIAVLVATLLASAGRAPRRSTTNGPIAYASGGRIHVIDASGATHDLGPGATPGATGQAFCCTLAWSPDGRRLLVASDDEVIVVNADGTGRVVIAGSTDAPGVLPAWSPDGSRVAVPERHQGDTQIFAVDADGSHRHQISSQVLFASSPAWSPDGTQIAFGAAALPDGTISGLYVVGADGSGIRRIAAAPDGWAADPWGPPSWSPDGRRLAFDTMQNPTDGVNAGHFQLYTVGAEGTGLAPLAGPDVLGFLPQWAPDGKHIAFARWLGQTARVDLDLVAPDGSGITTLAQGIAPEAEAWSPDSRQILVEQGYTGPCPISRVQNCPDPQANPYHQIESIAIDGSGSRVVVAVPVDGDLAWGGQS
jgi:dipeptidyl aminopeptidase/acylaminoacyl peptidase